MEVRARRNARIAWKRRAQLSAALAAKNKAEADKGYAEGCNRDLAAHIEASRTKWCAEAHENTRLRDKLVKAEAEREGWKTACEAASRIAGDTEEDCSSRIEMLKAELAEARKAKGGEAI
jgi:hypothetical protein